MLWFMGSQRDTTEQLNRTEPKFGGSMHDFHVRKICKDFTKKAALRFCSERTVCYFITDSGLGSR